MNTSKSLDEILEMVAVRSANQYGGFVGWEDDAEREEVIGEARAAIVEAVEGLKRDVVNKIKVVDGQGVHVIGVELLEYEFGKAIKEWQ